MNTSVVDLKFQRIEGVSVPELKSTTLDFSAKLLVVMNPKFATRCTQG
ncbi:hypothetical protein [Mesorhizobium sp. M9A.F.Ca.ET.002.03.1.2]|nr:hypothetical protein [Mesorhizobium sp. M9A.F.Ca.ET.002.03.1.2]